MSEPSTVQEALRKYKIQALFVSMPQALSGEQMCALGEAITNAIPTGSATTVVRLSSYGLESSKVSQGKLGEAHLRSEASLRVKKVPLVSIRPTSFFSNFDKYDLPSLQDGSFKIFSPLGHNASAKVNWVSCQDIGAVSAAYIRMAVEGSVPFQDGNFLAVEVTGGKNNTFALKEYTAMLTSVVSEVREGGGGREGNEVTYNDLPLPEDDDYRDLWLFLRAGGFDAVTDTLPRVLCREPMALRDHILEKLLGTAPKR